MNKFTTAEPGIYRHLPFDEYQAIDAVNNSLLNQMARSPAHALAWIEGRLPAEPTPALRLGQLCHVGVLEPASVSQRYVVMPPFERDKDNVTADGKPSTSKATAYYKAAVARFEALHEDREVVTAEHFRSMEGVMASICANADAARLLFGAGENELSIVWHDEQNNIRCKARVDRFVKRIGDSAAVIDLKTTRDAKRFDSAIGNYGYHRQAAWYCRGVATAYDIPIESIKYYLVAVEPTEPYGCRAAPLSEDAIRAGRLAVAVSLQQMRFHLDNDEWPGYDNPLEWTLPAWMIERSEEMQTWEG